MCRLRVQSEMVLQNDKFPSSDWGRLSVCIEVPVVISLYFMFCLLWGLKLLKKHFLLQILANKFTVIDKDGRSLILAGVLKQSDIDAALKGDKVHGKIMLDGLPAYCLLWNLIRSVKAKSSGILLSKFTVTCIIGRNWSVHFVIDDKMLVNLTF